MDVRKLSLPLSFLFPLHFFFFCFRSLPPSSSLLQPLPPSLPPSPVFNMHQLFPVLSGAVTLEIGLMQQKRQLPSGLWQKANINATLFFIYWVLIHTFYNIILLEGNENNKSCLLQGCGGSLLAAQPLEGSMLKHCIPGTPRSCCGTLLVGLCVFVKWEHYVKKIILLRYVRFMIVSLKVSYTEQALSQLVVFSFFFLFFFGWGETLWKLRELIK